MTKILSVATAAIHPDQLLDAEHARFPRIDYVELQQYLDTEILDYFSYEQKRFGKLLRALETQLRSDVYLATLSWWKSQGYSSILTWSERAGIPFSAYNRFLPLNSRLVTIFQCWSSRQEFTVKAFNLLQAMDSIIVHCESMRKKMIKLGARVEQVKLIHYSVDQNFFSPLRNKRKRENVIFSVGEPRSRDYATLFEAVRGLPVTLKVAGFGHWYAREKKFPMPESVPENVILLKHLSQRELQHQYASSKFVVIPVRNLVYSAGATTTMEAGSMARATIAFHSRGISDYIIDGETGILVEPGNIRAMREAIQYLLANPKEEKRMGENAHQRIVEEFNLDTYVRGIADVLAQNKPAFRASDTSDLPHGK
jgi:glycosyltransferase involved in cell wall biosynthesis